MLMTIGPAQHGYNVQNEDHFQVTLLRAIDIWANVVSVSAAEYS